MKNYLMKRYKELSKKERKGFTLVELLVVIAILAVLASVSVVGYLGFTEKARNSDAVTELTQVRELMRAELIDGEVETATYNNNNNTTVSMKYVDGKYYVLNLSASPSGDYTKQFKALFTDLSTLSATITVFFASTGATIDSTGTTNDYAIEYVNYVRTAGGNAHWKVSDDSINTGLYSAA